MLYYADNTLAEGANLNYVLTLGAINPRVRFQHLATSTTKETFGETEDTTIWSLAAKYSLARMLSSLTSALPVT